VVIGSNAIFIYMFTSLTHFSRGMDIFTAGIRERLGRAGLLFHELSVITLEWLLLFWMYKRKI